MLQKQTSKKASLKIARGCCSNMNAIEIFSGIGGFRLGLEQSGVSFDWVGFSEIDKYAKEVYKKHWPESEDLGDATTIDVSRLPKRIDLLMGGFPCQSFSIAGKRKGFEDTRGTLFFEIARIAKEKRPEIIFLENVRGLLSHDKGRTFETIIRTLGDLGYIVQWQVLNSKHFGVPQNRERVFIIGHLGRECFRKVFPIGDSSKKDNGERGSYSYAIDASYYKGAGNKKQRTLVEITKDKPDTQRIYDSSAIAKTLKSEGGGQGAKTGLYKVKEATKKGYTEANIGDSINLSVPNSKTRRGRVGVGVGVAQTLDTACNQAIPVLTPDRPNKRQNGRRFKENRDPSFTLTSQDRHGIYNGSRIRRLTPLECERLQGFPDYFTQYRLSGNEMSDTQRYKMMGNAVTVNVIEAIGRELF